MPGAGVIPGTGNVSASTHCPEGPTPELPSERMESAMVKRRFELGSVTIEEVREVLAEIESELADPNSDIVRTCPTDLDLSAVTTVSAEEAAEGDGGVTLAILLWAGGYAMGKVLDYLIDDVVRPRLRTRFAGRDLGKRKPADDKDQE